MKLRSGAHTTDLELADVRFSSSLLTTYSWKKWILFWKSRLLWNWWERNLRHSGTGRTDGNTACWSSAGESLWLSSWTPSRNRPSQAVCGAGLVCSKRLLPLTVPLTLSVQLCHLLGSKIWVVRHSRDYECFCVTSLVGMLWRWGPPSCNWFACLLRRCPSCCSHHPPFYMRTHASALRHYTVCRIPYWSLSYSWNYDTLLRVLFPAKGAYSQQLLYMFIRFSLRTGEVLTGCCALPSPFRWWSPHLCLANMGHMRPEAFYRKSYLLFVGAD